MVDLVRQTSMRAFGFRKSSTLLFCAFVLGGCAYSFVDTDGTQYIYGPSKITYFEEPQKSDGCEASQGPLLDRPIGITSFGLTWHRGRAGSVLGFGYTQMRDAGLHASPVTPCNNAKTAAVAELRTTYSLYSKRKRVRPNSEAGTVFAASTWGLAMVSTETESAMTIGYQSSALASIADNVLISGDPIRHLNRLLSPSNETKNGKKSSNIELQTKKENIK